jgi:hypothetical protein
MGELEIEVNKQYKNKACVDCNSDYKPTGPAQRRCPSHRLLHRKKVLQLWRDKNRKSERIRTTRWARKHPERRTVQSHRDMILNPKNKYHKYYKGMPFYSGWNPDKGGSLKAAETWIIKNLGKRPKGASMHIVKHDVGFVPGNLTWAYPKEQTNEQMFRILANQRHYIKELEKQIIKMGGKLT